MKRILVGLGILLLTGSAVAQDLDSPTTRRHPKHVSSVNQAKAQKIAADYDAKIAKEKAVHDAQVVAMADNGPDLSKPQALTNDATSEGWTFLGMGVVGLCFLGLFYFIPTLSALSRYHRNVAAIFMLNLFLGWTFVGWVIALVWAVKKDPVLASANA